MFKQTLLALALSSTALTAAAHQLWLERDASGPVRVYVGDADDAPDRGEEVVKISTTSKVFGNDPAKPVALVVKDDHLEAALPGTGDARLFNDQVWKPWKTREGALKAAVFNARAGRSETKAVLDYEFVPVTANASTFTLLFRGQPVGNKPVTVIAPEKWAKRFRTDAQGRIEVPVRGTGRYVLIAAHSVDEARQVAGETVAKVDYTATLSFVAP